MDQVILIELFFSSTILLERLMTMLLFERVEEGFRNVNFVMVHQRENPFKGRRRFVFRRSLHSCESVGLSFCPCETAGFIFCLHPSEAWRRDDFIACFLRGSLRAFCPVIIADLLVRGDHPESVVMGDIDAKLGSVWAADSGVEKRAP